MNEVYYYDHLKKMLKGNIISKAKKFIKFKCIQEIKLRHFICKPIGTDLSDKAGEMNAKTL